MRHGTRQLFGERARHGARRPAPGLVLRRHVAGFYSAVDNGLAIEGLGVAISNFYRRSVITRDGFVVTARGHRDYARAIREKILREISRVMG